MISKLIIIFTVSRGAYSVKRWLEISAVIIYIARYVMIIGLNNIIMIDR